MEPYGMPGDTGESCIGGPVYISSGMYIILPFYEDWNGGFEEKIWEVDNDSWIIDPDIGNPPKSASFVGDSGLLNYTGGLISFSLGPIDIVDGSVFLEFDLKLNDLNQGGTEHLTVKILDDTTWYEIDNFSNSGNIPWTHYQHDITDLTTTGCIRVGFFANGENSSNIEAWFIDNVYVYRLCAKPTNLTAEAEFHQDYSITQLNWEPPDAHYDQWLYYHDNSLENAVASLEAGQGLAQWFVPEHYPSTITEVRFFVADHLNYNNDIEVYILSGDGNTILAGPHTVQATDGNTWLDVDVEDVTIEEGNFMVAAMNTATEGPFIGTDSQAGDSTFYYGSIGNFTLLSQWGYEMTGSFEAYVEHSPSENIMTNSTRLKPVSLNIPPKIQSMDMNHERTITSSGRYMTGYNIWRNEEPVAYNWPESNYADTVYEAGEYEYYVSAVYDQCESDTSNHIAVSFYLDQPENTNQNNIHIYPNPVSEELFVKIEDPDEIIMRCTLTQSNGRPVLSIQPGNRQVILDVSGLPKGLYILNVVTNEQRLFRKVVVD